VMEQGCGGGTVYATGQANDNTLYHPNPPGVCNVQVTMPWGV